MAQGEHAERAPLSWGASTDIGPVRSENEDSWLAVSPVFAVADGMGGHLGGAQASSKAVITLRQFLSPERLGNRPVDLVDLSVAIDAAATAVAGLAPVDNPMGAPGTTLSGLMVLWTPEGPYWLSFNVGDSRAYVLRGDTLTQVTTDHSFVQYLVDTGQITPEEAEHHPNRNVVLKILGDAQADVSPDETIRTAVVGDRWMLCSDGLSGLVSPETIGQVMADFADPGECAEELIRLALLGGGPDNITCVIADIVPAGTYPPAPPQIVGAAAIDRNAKSRGGEGAAARAAALGAKSAVHGTYDDDAPVELKPLTSWWTPIFLSLVTVLVVAASWLSWKWTQTQYYAVCQDGYVVIYQGIPQAIGPWRLSHAIEVSDVALSDLSPVDRQRLDTPVLRSTRQEIDDYIEGLKRSSVTPSHETNQPGLQSGQSQSGVQSGEDS